MRRRNWIIGLVVLGAVGWYLFRPELVFVRTQVNESLPATASAETAGRPSAGAETPASLLTGSFHSVAHETQGSATVHQLPGGRRVLRLTQFTTSNGPDVRVYLVAASD